MGRQFAYGETMVDDVGCPAHAAGLVPGDGDATAVAEEYDERVYELLSPGAPREGLVDEDVAEEAWQQAVGAEARFLLDKFEAGDGLPTPYFHEDFEQSLEVADEMGWDVDGQDVREAMELFQAPIPR